MRLSSLRDRLARLLDVTRPPIVERTRRAAAIARRLGHDVPRAYSPQVLRAVELLQLQHIPEALLECTESIVDVGANVGDWSCAAHAVFPSATLRAFEPHPEVFSTLESRLADSRSARAHQLAISDSAGELDLHAYELSELSSLERLDGAAASVHRISAEPRRTYRVRTSTLDCEIPEGERIDILKLDVQGHEAAVIAGGLRTLRSTRVLMMEVTFTRYYEGDSDFWALHALLTAKTPLTLWDLAEVRRSPKGRAMWTDAVYVHAEHVP